MSEAALEALVAKNCFYKIHARQAGTEAAGYGARS